MRKQSAALKAGIALLVMCWACSGPTPRPHSTRTTSSSTMTSSSRVQATLPHDLATRELAFALEDGVYVGRADGRGIRRITDIPGFEYQPNWSSDGTKLLLRVDDESGLSGGVWSVKADGSDPVDLTKRAGVIGGTRTGRQTPPESRSSGWLREKCGSSWPLQLKPRPRASCGAQLPATVLLPVGLGHGGPSAPNGLFEWRGFREERKTLPHLRTWHLPWSAVGSSTGGWPSGRRRWS